MRMAVAWAGAVLVVAGAIVGGVAIANATVFSASTFARDYLDALRTDRVAEVLALPGVDAAGLDDRMLDSFAVDPFDYELGGETVHDGVHRIHVAFEAHGVRGSAALEIERIGTRFALFPRWGFARSPITPLTIEPTGDGRFTVGELPLDVPDADGAAFAALTPGVYRVAHESELLSGGPVFVAADGAPATARLAVAPTEAFDAAVAEALDTRLAECTTQTVLFPSGCPFGHAIENRVVSDPRWTISELAPVSATPSDEFGVWQVTGVTGIAHLEVEVQSLFDGTVSTLEHDVPFETGFLVAFDGGRIVLTATRDASEE